MNIECTKNHIEQFDKTKQIQVLQILHKHNVDISENNNGVFVNLSSLQPKVLNELNEFINCIHDKDKEINSLERKKTEYELLLL